MSLDSLDFIEVIMELEDMYGIDIADEATSLNAPADITREESTTLHKFVEVVCKKKGIYTPEKNSIQRSN